MLKEMQNSNPVQTNQSVNCSKFNSFKAGHTSTWQHKHLIHQKLYKKSITCSSRSRTYAARDNRKDSSAALSKFQLTSISLHAALERLTKTGPWFVDKVSACKTTISSILPLTQWHHFEIQCTSYKLLLNRIRLDDTLAEPCSQPSFDWSNIFKLQLGKFWKSKRFSYISLQHWTSK